MTSPSSVVVRHPSIWKAWRMRVADARSVLEDLARSDGQEVETLTPPEAVGLMVRFYSEIRADDVDLACAGDQLFVSWGTWDWGEGPSFQYSIRRQFYVADTSPDQADDGIWSLELLFRYEPTPESATLGSGSEGCDLPQEAERVREVVATLAATQYAKRTPPAQVEFTFRQDG